MIDESMNIFITCIVVVFTSFVEDGLPLYVFIGLLQINYGKKNPCSIFKISTKTYE